MADSLAMTAQLAGQGVRVGWYFGIGRVLDWRARQLGATPGSYRPKRPVPDMRELMASLGQLLLADATAVRDGLYPPMPDGNDTPLELVARVRAMFADLPSAIERRAQEDAGSARTLAGGAAAAELPDYFTQDFHFQTGGYLTDDSARLYDVQVETLFMGSAGPMRRAALRPIAEYIRGRDQRQMALLDVACGTGRLLRQVRLAFPGLKLTGLDLSRAYIDEARRHFGSLRPATWIGANAEAVPLPDASQDVVTSVFLFHELPPDVRRRVTSEMARVLKPGGLLVLIDSLQMGDRPGWDGLLEAFPVRFHEPYFRHYAVDDLDAMFSASGLAPRESSLAFLSKVLVRQKAA
jgi:ubiquinone/menaquinone biosynthesis C-methylase UbiE